MKRILVAVFVMVAVLATSILAVGGKDAAYVGGTIPGLKEKTEGKLVTTSDQVVAFAPNKKGEAPVEIPYSAIKGLEYGQKAGRRVAVAVMISPLALFSKKRNHYLTISYTDASGKDQAGVFELGKDIVRTTLTILKTRSGNDIEYQDDEARKAGAQ